jgi:lipoprotein signal peptidase
VKETIARPVTLSVPTLRISASALCVAVGIACYLGSRFQSWPHSPILSPDSYGYLYPPARGVAASSGLWYGLVPPCPTAACCWLFWLLGRNPAAIIHFQALLSTVAWLALGFVAMQSLRMPWVKVAVFGAILLLGQSAPVVAVDTYVLTESFSFSVLALLFAAGLWFAVWPDWWKVAAIAVLALAWSLTRDTNGISLIIGAIFAGVGYAVMRRRPSAQVAAILAVFMISGAVSMWDANRGERGLFPMYNVLSRRLVYDGPAMQFFEAHGMPPVAHQFMQHHIVWASSKNLYLYRAPEMQPLHRWVIEHGRTTYAKWLLASWYDSLNDALSHGAFIWQWAPAWLFYLLPLLIAASWRRWDARYAVAALLLAVAFPTGLMCYFGDTMEVERHCAQVPLMVAASAIVACGLIVEALTAAVGKQVNRFNSRSDAETGSAI